MNKKQQKVINMLKDKHKLFFIMKLGKHYFVDIYDPDLLVPQTCYHIAPTGKKVRELPPIHLDRFERMPSYEVVEFHDKRYS